ncbi:hypothetical protein KIN20_027359 [Parelaphostrongylus tenuis]|uniref:Uncharacterized protein n=1 Tax=Parelaphostrongylus tenuis TaxID=148309 RepID=A0AAD5QZ87_PARTN|nr:hypothetical protein KIN20_027359 [Parelaphostrongylus tenuis]
MDNNDIAIFTLHDVHYIGFKVVLKTTKQAGSHSEKALVLLSLVLRYKVSKVLATNVSGFPLVSTCWQQS